MFGFRRNNMPNDERPDEGGTHKSDEPTDYRIDSDEIQQIVDLENRIAELEGQLADANARAIRALADFQNFQRRSLQNEIAAKQDGVSGVVRGVVNALDHFDLALHLDPAKSTAEQIVGGVRVIRDELLKVLAQQGVSMINPADGDDFQPGRHEAIMQMQKDGVESGQVAQTLQAGYVLSTAGNDRVLRPAKVAVAP